MRSKREDSFAYCLPASLGIFPFLFWGKATFLSAGIAGVIKPYSDLHTDSEIRYFPSIDSVDVVAEGVIIATPTTLHAANGIAAAARGWHMLIEKPVVAAPA